MNVRSDEPGTASTFLSSVAAFTRRSDPHDDPARRVNERSLLEQCLQFSRTGIAVASLFGLLFQAGSIAIPWFLARGVDDGIAAGRVGAALAWAVGVALLGAVLVVGECGMRWWSRIASDESTDRLRMRITRHLLTLDSGSVERFGHGDLASRGIHDLDLIKTWIHGLASFVTGSLGFVAILVGMALIDPLLMLVVAAIVPLLALLRVAHRRRIGPVNQAISAAQGDCTEAVEDVLTATAAIRGIGGETVLAERHRHKSAELSAHVLWSSRITAVWTSLPDFLPLLGTAVGVGIAGAAVLAGRASIGELVAFTAWMTMLATWTGTLTVRTTQLSQARMAAARVAELLRLRPSLRVNFAPTPLPTSGALIAHSVTTRREDHVVGPFDFAVGAGQMVAITGAIGSGKTELLRLLARLKDPNAGQVTFGGVDLRNATIADVRDRITLVPQRPLLVSGTLADNLRLGRDDLPDELLHAACYVAVLDTFVASLPYGLDTPVGERGSMLSGGQRQRVAVARALLREPAVLLLDDATSAIDVDTEALLLARLRNWTSRHHGQPPASVVLVSHRPGVLAAADPVIELAGKAGGR